MHWKDVVEELDNPFFSETSQATTWFLTINNIYHDKHKHV